MIDLPPPDQECIVIYEDQVFSLNEIYAYDPPVTENIERITMSKEQVNLLLYIRASCPYCQKVQKTLHKMGKTVPQVDISKNQEALEELIRVGGKKQVPCLFINGKAHYESDWIIDWLKKNKKLLKDS